jgi:hypothetical protein
MEIQKHLVSLKSCRTVKKDTLDMPTVYYFATSIKIKTYTNGTHHFFQFSYKMEIIFNLNLVTTVDIISLYDKTIDFSSKIFLKIFLKNILIL